MSWRCGECGKLNSDDRQWCASCSEPRDSLGRAHFKAVKRQLEREAGEEPEDESEIKEK
jgi:hypothetical protein